MQVASGAVCTILLLKGSKKNFIPSSWRSSAGLLETGELSMNSASSAGSSWMGSAA